MRCCDLLNHCYFELRPARCCVHPPFAELPPRRFTEHSLGFESRLKRGYEPPGARCARHCFTLLCGDCRHLGDVHPTCGGGPEDRAPMEVPDLRAVLPNFETSLPQRDLLPPSAREPEASRPVSTRPVLQSACQSPERSAPDSTRSCIPWVSFTLRRVFPHAFRACDGSGEARCHRLEVTTRSRRHNPIGSAAAHSRLSPPG